MGSPTLRILHVNHAADWRGGEQQTLYLLEGLQQGGHTNVLAAPGRGILAARARALGIEVIPLEARGDLSWRARGVLGAHAPEVHIVHAHTARAHGWVRSAYTASGLHTPVVVHRRVDAPIKGGWGASWKYGGVDRYLAVSDCVARVMEAGGIPRERIRRVYSGIRSERFDLPSDGPGLRTELGVNGPLVAYVGALVPHKGPDVLVEAAAGLPRDVHVLLAGEGPMRGALQERIQELGLAGRVHLLGRRNDIPRLLRSVDVFSLPSRTEGLGTSILDAMAAEVPVVAGRTGGIPEIVEDGISGLLVPPDSPEALSTALDRVLSDASLAAALRKAGRERVRKFSDRRMVEETLAVYHELVPGKS